ncbi:MAG: SPOR domain-containing protein [Sulfuricurvum sp.]|nr:SPOR domain-containing protein [Sulfuricurvum sp.]
MIKKIVLIAAMGTIGLLWGSGDVTIQVINAVKERSITAEFDKKLAKSGLSIHKVVEGGRYIVTLGTYKDAKSAQAALKKARGIVCKEAFIRPVNRNQVAVAHETVAAKQPVVAHAEVKEVAAVAAHKEEHVVIVQVKPVVVEVKNSSVATAVSTSSSEKKEAYRNEIAEAINYYKNSPYHRFEPVKLQQ